MGANHARVLPAFLPACGELSGVPGERLNVDPKRTLRRAWSNSIVDQLKIGAAGLAEPLPICRSTSAFRTKHFFLRAKAY